MNDALVMSGRNRIAHVGKQLQAFLYRQLVLIGVLGQVPGAGDVLHREVVDDAGFMLVLTDVEDLHDPRMLQARQRLPLDFEEFHVETRLHRLEGNCQIQLVLPRLVDDAHPTRIDQTLHVILTDAVVDEVRILLR